METQKVFAPWSNMAWGGSGRGGTIEQVGNHLGTTFTHRTRFASKKRHEIRKEAFDEVAKKVREILGRAIPVQGMGPPHAEFLFVGYAQDGPFILEFHRDLTDTDHTDIGYAAIGSGDIFPYFALASLKHFNVRQRTLNEAKLIAYRVVQDAINVAARDLGPPVQMIEIAEPAAGQPVNAQKLDDEMRVLEEKVVEWKEAESEALTRFVGLSTEPTAETVSPTAPAAGANEAIVEELLPPDHATED